MLSQAEAEGSAELQARFTQLDSDSSGSLSPSEFAAFEQQQTGESGGGSKGANDQGSTAGSAGGGR